MSSISPALLQHRIVRLFGSVNKAAADNIISELLLLDAEDHESAIDLYINSPGGTMVDGMAIIDAMLCIQAPVTTICIGQAASIAAAILAAGTPGRRMASPHAEIMIHQPSGDSEGQASDLQTYADQLMAKQRQLIALLAAWTGRPKDQVKDDIDRNFFLTPEEAREYGLIDGILQPYRRGKSSSKDAES